MAPYLYRHLPPLNALRAFEASVRHRSFTLAGQELSVTQGAVSRQVDKLEQHLGTKLFLRTPGRLTVTEEGKVMAKVASAAFENIDGSIEVLFGVRSSLRFQVAPSYAIRWLMPRLSDFTDQHERLDIRVTITIHPPEFDAQCFDAGIIYGDGNWPGLASYELSREVLIPVCSPSHRAGPHPLRKPEDLEQHTLLHSSSDRRDWPLWLSAVQAGRPNAIGGPTFETMDMCVRAAEAGHGVAIGDLSLIHEDIERGVLCTPFDYPVNSGRGLYFVCLKERKSAKAIKTLRDWVIETSPLGSKQ